MNKSEVKKLVEQMRDYIPGGKPVDVQSLTFRRTHEHEVLLCGTRTGHDIQSGPFYCGAVADWFAPVPEGAVAVCDRHAKRLHIKTAASR
jgi:hypothetical protein